MNALLILGVFTTGSCSGISLELNRGARPFSMGGSFIGVNNDISSFYYNPATLGGIDALSVDFSYFSITMDIKDNSLLLAYPYGRFTSGLSISYLDYGKFTGMDEHARNERMFDASDLIVNCGLSYSIRKNTYLGGEMKYFESRIDTFQTTSYSLNLGLSGITELFQWGFALRNVGKGLEFINEDYNLPMIIGAGIAKEINKDIFLTGALEIPIDHFPVISTGMEYSLLDILFLRTGFRSDRAGILSKFSFGLGLSYNKFNFDFGFSTLGDFGNSYIISVKY